MNLNIQDTFNKELTGDPNKSDVRRQVYDALYASATPRKPSDPTLLHVSTEVAELLDISQEELKTEEFLNIFSGAEVIDGTMPYAMLYGGHQFGNWAGQLGDGRAINLAEVVNKKGDRWALQLKGSGITPFSRTADGLAVLRSSIREHLCSEAMFHLGVPTTRSLSLSLTGDNVLRDMLYDGNPAYEKGAVVCRVSPSFIRFGNFQILASRSDIKNLRELTDYTIRHYFPEIEANGSKESYLAFFQEVVSRTRKMVTEWQRVGFVHGVMNTDNMSILGLTIDYGPYGWLEPYDETWTPNTTDASQSRYRFGNQPMIALWNLFQLGNALFPLVEEAAPLEAILNDYREGFFTDFLVMMGNKLGFENPMDMDQPLIQDLEKMLQLTETDMTIFFRNLANFKVGDDWKETIIDAFYAPDEVAGTIEEQWTEWFGRYEAKLKLEKRSYEERKESMNKVNPKYVLRNYMAQLAIDAADNGDYSIIDELHQLLKKPYSEQVESEKWFVKRPEWARNKVGCSTLSCSS